MSISLERMYRDVRITPIYEGTNQIQHLVIAREAVMLKGFKTLSS